MTTRAEYETAVAACGTPEYHATHRYCPSCPWTERGWPFSTGAVAMEATAEERRVPRMFELVRDEDVSGISGTGAVAWGCEFPDGVVALRWATEWPSSVVWYDRGMEAVEAVHGHQGRTRIVRVEPAPAPLDRSALKIAVCEYLLSLNRDDHGRDLPTPFIPPTAIDWIGNGLVTSVLAAARAQP